ncbi:VOC family protein [Actinoplanes sp. ATCC 53533]|uniref:VOC family protein n=1 Tax=Actinoplanes sp. ATCC 53533 TaxID=1288362 RepID=UPI001F28A50E|nr:VOC family protein [Actinoplanes sp. ATCC 53533]
MMDVRWVTGFLDTPSRAASPVSAEAFWQAVTGSGLSARRGPGGEFATLVPAGGDAYLRVQVVGDGPARAHLDLHVEDVPAQARRAVTLGAVVVLDEEDLVVLRSPAGLPFCLVAWRGEAVRPAGGRSLVDQMCLDVPVGGFDAEADFWAALTGWQRRPGSLPEFDFLVRPDGMPLRLLLQRVDAAAGMHLDLACTDRAAEVAWHVSLGATVVAVYERWTTLRDPAGRVYCVTDRPV